MAEYYQISFHTGGQTLLNEILIAQLSERGFDFFEELDELLLTGIKKEAFDISVLDDIPLLKTDVGSSINWTCEELESRNWNKEWEDSVEPVRIGSAVLVRADFHPVEDGFEHVINIHPKMAFGTGHHETTLLMMEWLLLETPEGKDILDMGCGTGLLAILADMLGAKSVLAIDNDTLAVESALENIAKNGVKNVSVQKGDAEMLPEGELDTIIANINRNIILQDLTLYVRALREKGQIYISGFYTDDLEKIREAAKRCNLRLAATLEKNNWCSAKFIKSPTN